MNGKEKDLQGNALCTRYNPCINIMFRLCQSFMLHANGCSLGKNRELRVYEVVVLLEGMSCWYRMKNKAERNFFTFMLMHSLVLFTKNLSIFILKGVSILLRT